MKRKVATRKQVVAKAATSQDGAAKRPAKAQAGGKRNSGKTQVANEKKAAPPRIAKAKSAAHSSDPLRSLAREAALRRLSDRVG